MRIDEALKTAAELPSETASLDAELLLAEVMQVDRVYLRTWPERQLNVHQLKHFQTLMARRQRGEPVAHILGRQGFWNLDLEVSSATLIPRPDTETLVEQALQHCHVARAEVLDLGTGTGAVALALASERPAWHVVAVDRVHDAIVLAQKNAARLAIRNVECVQSSWFAALAGREFDLIVSNPPYIDPEDPHLAQGDVRYEPASALVSDEQGLADLRHIAQHAGRYLRSGGWLMVEHGYDQGERVAELFIACGFDAVETCRDLAGQDRVTIGRKREEK